jgi:hypothetical protein
MNRTLFLSLLLAACEYNAPIGADNDAASDRSAPDVAEVPTDVLAGDAPASDLPMLLDGDLPPRDVADVPSSDVLVSDREDVPRDTADVPPPPDAPAATFACATGRECLRASQLCQGPRPPGICPRPDAGICPQGCPGCPALPPPTCEAMPAACVAAPTCECILRALCGQPAAGACAGDAASGFTASCQGV